MSHPRDAGETAGIERNAPTSAELAHVVRAKGEARIKRLLALARKYPLAPDGRLDNPRCGIQTPWGEICVYLGSRYYGSNGGAHLRIAGASYALHCSVRFDCDTGRVTDREFGPYLKRANFLNNREPSATARKALDQITGLIDEWFKALWGSEEGAVLRALARYVDVENGLVSLRPSIVRASRALHDCGTELAGLRAEEERLRSLAANPFAAATVPV